MDTRIALLRRWYTRHKRNLPWRTTRDPYKILVSEIMLQQTQVDRVIVFYKRWLKQFPSWAALAHARTDVLLRAWAGLGYNRRALQLREAARQVVAHGEPIGIDAWKKLKGVGPYTAAAVHAITARQRVIVIDTNVRRVAGRLFLGIPYPGLTNDPGVSKALDRFIPKQAKYWEFPQILMDFATAVCTSKNPSCASCPLRMQCKAAQKFFNGTAGKKPHAVSRERIHVGKKFPDRIYRGRILALVRDGRAHAIHGIGRKIDSSFVRKNDTAWLHAVISRLVRDGMITQKNGRVSLMRA